MREIGIVKWFGGYNTKLDRENNYGFIAREAQPDLYVHRNQLPDGQAQLSEGDIVLFDVAGNGTNGKAEARNVHLLTQDSDADAIELAAQSTEIRIWKIAFLAYLSNGGIEQAATLVEQKLPEIARREDRRSIVRSLPMAILQHHPALRAELTADERVDLYLEGWRTSPNLRLNPAHRAEIAATAREASAHKRVELTNAIPRHLLLTSVSLRAVLSPERHVQLLVDMLTSAAPDDKVDEEWRGILIEEVAELLARGTYQLWTWLPLNLVMEPVLWRRAPSEVCIERIEYALEKGVAPADDLLVERLVALIAETPESCRMALLKRIMHWAQRHDQLVGLLPLRMLPVMEQLEWAWPLLQTWAPATWSTLSREAKILSVYRAAKEQIELPLCEAPDREPDALCRSALTLLRARSHPAEAHALFAQANRLIEDLVVEQAWSSNEPLDFYPLLPICRSALVHVAYCEGRPWEKLDGTAAFCPRASAPCSFYGIPSPSEEETDVVPAPSHARRSAAGAIRPSGWTIGDEQDRMLSAGNHFHQTTGWKLVDYDVTGLRYVYAKVVKRSVDPTKEHSSYSAELERRYLPKDDAKPYRRHYGAHIRPIASLDWHNWSLIELLDAVGVRPQLAGLRDPRDYVNKLAGWTNRLNEIRERLKCSSCGKIMRPNYKYARFLARYSATVVGCDCGSVANQNVYLNHCWACEKIIDSRESRHKAGGLCICIHCGSGPRPPRQYSQAGDEIEWFENTYEQFEHGVPNDNVTADTFAQGDICPSCGAPGMVFQQYHKNRWCRACQHIIQLPLRKHLTGPKCQHCQDGKTTLIVPATGEPGRYCPACKTPAHLGPKDWGRAW